MILFKGIKAKEVGGLFIFPKRKSSSSLFVVEFAIFPYSELMDPTTNSSSSNNNINYNKENTIGNIKKHLLIKNYSREFSCFHIEFNERDESFRVCFETFAESKSKLIWKQGNTTKTLCRFVISDETNIDQAFSMGNHSLKELMAKLFILTHEYPELLYHTYDISKMTNRPTVLSSFQFLLSCAKDEWNGYTAELSKFDIEKSFETMPSIEECVSDILRIETNQSDYKDRVNTICNEYLKKLKMSKRILAKPYRSFFFNSGFLDMCQIAKNGNSFALELCNHFLTSIIGRGDDSIILHIGDYDYISTRSLNNIIFDFLSEYSIIQQGNETFDENEREKLFSTIEKLQKSEHFLFFMPNILSHSSMHNYNIDLLILNYQDFIEIKAKQEDFKFGSGIMNEVFFNAAISARKGSKQCLDFYEVIPNHLSECNSNSMVWYIALNPNPENTFKVYQYLKDVIRLPLLYTWIARMKIIGIPNFLESNVSDGYQELVDIYSNSKFSDVAAAVLGLLFFKGVPGILDQDFERALFWFSKDTIYNYEGNIEYIQEKGIKIQHSDEYFLNFKP